MCRNTLHLWCFYHETELYAQTTFYIANEFLSKMGIIIGMFKRWRRNYLRTHLHFLNLQGLVLLWSLVNMIIFYKIMYFVFNSEVCLIGYDTQQMVRINANWIAFLHIGIWTHSGERQVVWSQRINRNILGYYKKFITYILLKWSILQYLIHLV
jgi:hypothetical protein